MAATSETESVVHENMTRIRMKMVQRKLANEREKLNRPDSSSSDGEAQYKLQQALLRRQQLLDKLKQEQAVEEQRARTTSPRPRRRYTASTLPPPPSRRSLPGDLLRSVSRAYHFNWYNNQRPREMVPNNYVIEHQYRHDPPVTQREVLPQIVHVAAPPQPPPPPQQHIVLAQPSPPPPPQQHIVVAQPPPPPPPPPPQQIVLAQPPPPPPPPPQITTIQPAQLTCRANEANNPFKKSDFMDMMMLQNAQMHHMVMQQMMLHNLPGSVKLPTTQIPLAPVRAVVGAAPPPPPPVVHHMQTLPPLEPRLPVSTRVYNNAATFYDDGSNYFTYH